MSTSPFLSITSRTEKLSWNFHRHIYQWPEGMAAWWGGSKNTARLRTEHSVTRDNRIEKIQGSALAASRAAMSTEGQSQIMEHCRDKWADSGSPAFPSSQHLPRDSGWLAIQMQSNPEKWCVPSEAEGFKVRHVVPQIIYGIPCSKMSQVLKILTHLKSSWAGQLME